MDIKATLEQLQTIDALCQQTVAALADEEAEEAAAEEEEEEEEEDIVDLSGIKPINIIKISAK